MNFAILIFCSFFVGILGDPIAPNEQLSDIYVSADDLSGPWLLIFFGPPKGLSRYPDDMKCLRAWFGKVNDTYMNFNKYIILEDDSKQELPEGLVLYQVGDKYGYTVIYSQGEYSAKVIDFDKYKYIAGYVFGKEGQKYLFVYARDINVLNTCEEKLKSWLENSDNKNLKESYRVDPETCMCAFDKK